jgi:uncharacterized protein
LTVLPGRFGVCRLTADDFVPGWATGELVSVTCTSEELSVVCAQDVIPDLVTAEEGGDA